jgi:hypothetical protein
VVEDEVVRMVLVTTSLGQKVNWFLAMMLMGKVIFFTYSWKKNQKVHGAYYEGLYRLSSVVGLGGKEVKPSFTSSQLKLWGVLSFH